MAGSEGEPGCGEGGPEGGVAHHRGVPDPVQGFEGVAEPDRVQSPPLAVGEHAGVDLQMQMAVWVTGP